MPSRLTIGFALLPALLLCAPGAAADPPPSPTRVLPPASPEPEAATWKWTRPASPRLFRLKTLARQDLQARRFQDAYHRLRPNVGEARGDAEYLALLALAAMQVGSYGEALVIYERLAALQPESGGWRVGLGLAREQLGLDAGEAYRQALTLIVPDPIRELVRERLAELVREKLAESDPPKVT